VFGERQVNSYTDNAQDEPSVAGLADGGYVIVWDSVNQDGDLEGVFGQRYDANGVITGPEFLVNTTVLSWQSFPTVTGLTGGGFVVSWADFSPLDGSGWGIVGQLYNAAGDKVGGEFVINSTTSSSQLYPEVTSLTDGGFVVVWEDQVNADGNSWGIFGQRYDASGNTVGGEFQVNTEFLGQQQRPSVIGLNDGGFVVVWDSVTSGTAGDGDGQGVFGQRYDNTGAVVGGEFQINTEITNNQFDPAVASLTDGGFVVTWTSTSQDASSNGVFAQRFDASGNAVGDEFRVNETTSGAEDTPAIIGLTTGGFVIAWGGTDASGVGIFGQQYDASGNRVDGEFQINTEFSSTQDFPELAALPNGNFVAVWPQNSRRCRTATSSPCGNRRPAARPATAAPTVSSSRSSATRPISPAR
jgi:hypothetical protein